MALQVWLPLNGNLNNQGLTDITVTNSGATVDNNGKIGKCLSFNGTSSVLHCDDIGLDTSKDYTLACWFYLNAIPTGSNARLIQISVSTDTAFSNMSTGIVVDYLNSGSQGKFALVDGGSYTYYNYNFLVNTWYHVTYTKQGDTKKLYLNGELLTTLTFGGSSRSPKHFYVGGTGAANRMLNGKMNDVRVYDSCLSDREIEILSRGLVCHYPLNGGGRGGDNMCTWGYTRNPLFSGNAGTTKLTDTDYGEYRRYTCTTAGTSGGRYGYPRTAGDLAQGTVYTWSAEFRANKQLSFTSSSYIGMEGGGLLAGSDIKIDTEWRRLSKTWTQTTSQAFVLYPNDSVAVNDWIDIRNLKIEVGDKATPYIPNPADTTYTAMGYNSTTEYDVSGYGNNGTKNGTITYSSDTPRYNVSTKIGSTSSYIQIPNLTTSGFSNSYSFAWWGKVPTYTGRMMWGFGDGMRLNGIYNGNLWNTGDGSSNPLYVPGTTTQVTVPTANVWHHWVMTGDGTTCKVYQDGVLWATAKTYKSTSGTTIYINGWSSGTDYTYSDYQMSDFRIYATALSATQVAELYNTAVSVANNGTLMGYELVEV